MKEVASTIKNFVRHADVVARFGGDEFVVLQPMTEEKDSAMIAETLCRLVSDKEWDSEVGDLEIHISLGVASLSGSQSKSGKELVKCADKALYEGKESGRNQVCTHSSLMAKKIR